MKRNNTNNERRGISPFSHIRLGLHTEDEFIRCLPEEKESRPDYYRWFCGLHSYLLPRAN